MDMLFIVPTRSRPENVARQLEAINRTRCYTDILYVVDSDDPRAEEYSDVLAEWQEPWVRTRLNPSRLMLGPKLNEASTLHALDYDFIGFMGDDHMPRTPIWDGLMAAELRGKRIGMVYGDDRYQGKNLPTSICMTSSIIEVLGYMIPPEIEHLYCDNFWLDLGRALNAIEYREDIVIEHIHPSAGKAESDAQYAEVNSDEQFRKDKAGLERYRSNRFGEDIRKLMNHKEFSL